MSVKECPICFDSFAKKTGLITDCCTKRLCPTCAPKCEKCPFCRNSPLVTLSLYKVTAVEQPKDIQIDFSTLNRNIDIISENIKLLTIRRIEFTSTRNCGCRNDCKHSRCKCIKHNPKYVNKALNSMNELIREALEALVQETFPFPFLTEIAQLILVARPVFTNIGNDSQNNLLSIDVLDNYNILVHSINETIAHY